jgi:hypothetical protein
VLPIKLTDVVTVGGGGGFTKSFDSEKAWFSINHSILFVLQYPASDEFLVLHGIFFGKNCVLWPYLNAVCSSRPIIGLGLSSCDK